jgi:hypothetical protein
MTDESVTSPHTPRTEHLRRPLDAVQAKIEEFGSA